MTPRKEVSYFIFCADLQLFNFVFFHILSAFVVLNLYSQHHSNPLIFSGFFFLVPLLFSLFANPTPFY